MTGHWERTCRTARHLVDLYQASLKDKRKRVESHAIKNAGTVVAPEINTTSVLA